MSDWQVCLAVGLVLIVAILPVYAFRYLSEWLLREPLTLVRAIIGVPVTLLGIGYTVVLMVTIVAAIVALLKGAI